MSAAKLTPWFKVGKDGPPTREGWYDVKYQGDAKVAKVRFYWDGVIWKYFYKGNMHKAAFGNFQDCPCDAWRGLVKQ